MTADLWDNSAVRQAPEGATFAGRAEELDLLLAVLTGLETTGARTVMLGATPASARPASSRSSPRPTRARENRPARVPR